MVDKFGVNQPTIYKQSQRSAVRVEDRVTAVAYVSLHSAVVARASICTAARITQQWRSLYSSLYFCQFSPVKSQEG